jgi:hypothetical protein
MFSRDSLEVDAKNEEGVETTPSSALPGVLPAVSSFAV